MKHELNITKGAIPVFGIEASAILVVKNFKNEINVASINKDEKITEEEYKANFEVLADAWKNYELSGIKASELRKQRDELKQTLKMVRRISEIRGLMGIVKECDETLKNCE